MSFSNKKIVYGGLAMASVALLAVGVAFYPVFEQQKVSEGDQITNIASNVTSSIPSKKWREIRNESLVEQKALEKESLTMADVAAPPVATRQASPEIAEGFVASQAMNRAVSPQAKILSMPVEPVPPQPN